MARTTWTPNDEQKKMLASLKRAYKKADDAEAEARKLLAQCSDAGIPIARMAEDLDVERKTIYRHLGRSMT